MSVNLRNTSGGPVFLGANGKFVEADEIVHVEGEVSDDSPDDAYLIGDRAWPKGNWTNAGGKSTSEPDVTTNEEK